MRRISDNQTVVPVSPTQRIRRPPHINDGSEEPAKPPPRPSAEQESVPDAADDREPRSGTLIDKFV